MNDGDTTATNNTSADTEASTENTTENTAAQEFYPDKAAEADDKQEGQEPDDAEGQVDEGDEEKSSDGESEESSDENSDESEAGYTDFETPEGVEIDEQSMAAALPIFQDLNATQEQAQGLIDTVSDMLQRQQQANIDTWSEKIDAWGEEAKADKEIGGDKLEQSLHLASKAVEQFGKGLGMNEVFEMTGIGNHPSMVKFLTRVGKHFSEGSAVTNGNNPSGGEESAADVFYPNQK